jgi:hypothetical protein
MTMKLLTLMVGAAMLSGAGIADAADAIKPVGTQRFLLSDTQMGTLTAGHLWHPPYKNNNKLHYGWYYTPIGGITVGWHRRCGAAVCPG